MGLLSSLSGRSPPGFGVLDALLGSEELAQLRVQVGPDFFVFLYEKTGCPIRGP